jgi:thymidylate synthase (FAD)
MNAKLMYATPIWHAAAAAKLCYTGKLEFDSTKQDFSEFLAALYRKGHESPLEFAWMGVYVEGVTRVALAQITRHRLFSFCVQSGRYTEDKGSASQPVLKDKTSEQQQKVWDHIEEGYQLYQELIDSGVKKEEARYILPQGALTNLAMAGNLRQWMHFWKLRTRENGAQDEIVRIANATLWASPEDYCDFLTETGFMKW